MSYFLSLSSFHFRTWIFIIFWKLLKLTFEVIKINFKFKFPLSLCAQVWSQFSCTSIRSAPRSSTFGPTCRSSYPRWRAPKSRPPWAATQACSTRSCSELGPTLSGGGNTRAWVQCEGGQCWRMRSNVRGDSKYEGGLCTFVQGWNPVWGLRKIVSVCGDLKKKKSFIWSWLYSYEIQI